MYGMDVRCGMQFERFYSLNDSIVYDFRELSQIWGYLCGGNGMNVLPFAHPQLFKVLKHLIYV